MYLTPPCLFILPPGSRLGRRSYRMLLFLPQVPRRRECSIAKFAGQSPALDHEHLA